MKPGPYKLQVDIYNERDYLVTLDVRDIYANFKPRVEWINEKLLYVRLWWGRVLGVDFIFDVEKEQVICKDNINDGGIPFLQWQQAKGIVGNSCMYNRLTDTKRLDHGQR
jgi:hypothetical protein